MLELHTSGSKDQEPDGLVIVHQLTEEKSGPDYSLSSDEKLQTNPASTLKLTALHSSADN